MSFLQDTISSLISQLPRVSSTPLPPLGFGVDVLCVSDFEPSLTETDGGSVLSLAQDIFHAVTTPRGGIPDAPNRGVDLRQLLSLGVTSDKLRNFATQAHGEILKDDRVNECSVAITPLNSAAFIAPSAGVFDITFDDSFNGASGPGTVRFAYRVSIAVTPNIPGLSVFTLIIAVTDGAALLQEIQ